LRPEEVIGLIVPGSDSFAIDVSLGATQERESARRRCAEVIRIEGLAVVFDSPQAPCTRALQTLAAKSCSANACS
jgi:hypothetical protein